MSLNKMKISLDSTVFGNPKFILWLKRNMNYFSISISVIVVLETFHWYNFRGIPKESFDKMLQSLNPKIINLKKDHIETVSENALLSQLQFKHHSRDLIIATHSMLEKSIVITDNTKHFKWMNDKPMSPEDLVMHVNKNINKNS